LPPWLGQPFWAYGLFEPTPKQAKMHIDIKMATTTQRPFFCVVLPALGKAASGPVVGLAKAMIEPPQNMYA
jgi:hypothetical protein